MQPVEPETTYPLPCGPNAPQWAQALAALARRAQEYHDQGFQTDAQLAALFNSLHIEMIQWPLGREGQR